MIVVGLVVVTTAITALLALDDDAWFDRRAARQARKRSHGANVTDVPGVVFVQFDGVAHARAAAGDPIGGRSEPASVAPRRQPPPRQVGDRLVVADRCQPMRHPARLDGRHARLPLARQVDRRDRRVEPPQCAAAIERAHSDGNGLLAHNGSSYGNLFSGDAERAVLTMSGAGRRKEGRTGAGYFGYFSRPGQTIRTCSPRSSRSHANGWRRPGSAAAASSRASSGTGRTRSLRTFTTVITRDVSVQGVMNDMCEGRAAIYVDLLGYDEVSHHSGPERVDTLAVLRDLDRQVGRIERTRPLDAAARTRSSCSPTTARPRVRHSSSAPGRPSPSSSPSCAAPPRQATPTPKPVAPSRAPGSARHATPTSRRRRSVADVPIVLGSGSLGLISIPGTQHRLTREEIEARYPRLIDGLAAHPEIGFVLVRQASGSSIVLGNHGSRDLTTGEVVGDDPLEPFGPRAASRSAKSTATAPSPT